jgi:hypothetical protein
VVHDRNLNDSLLSSLSSLTSLTSLKLYNCGRGGRASVRALCAALSSLPHLTHLDLGDFIFDEQVISEPALKSHERIFVGGQPHRRLVMQTRPLSEESINRLIDCLNGQKALKELTLPPDIQQWESLNALPALQYLCLSSAHLERPCDPPTPEEDKMEILDSWVSRIEAFKTPVLFGCRDSSADRKESLLCHVAHSYEEKFVSHILKVPRTDPSLQVNFAALDGLSPIFHVIDPGVLRVLVNAGANINATCHSKTKGLFTPLRSFANKHSLVKAALDLGADPLVGLAIIDTMIPYAPKSFLHVWEILKDKMHLYDDGTISKIATDAFMEAVLGDGFYLRTLLPVIGETRTYEFVKAEEASIAALYRRMAEGVQVEQLLPALAAGVNLRLPQGPIERSAVWHLYVMSSDPTRQLIKENGILTESEMAAADASGHVQPRRMPAEFQSFYK